MRRRELADLLAEALYDRWAQQEVARLDRLAHRVSWDCLECFPNDVPDPYCKHARPILEEMRRLLD